MPNFLSDPPTALYGLLVLLTVVPLLAALFFTAKTQPSRSSHKKSVSRRTMLFAVAGVGLTLLLALGLCDFLFESDREQVIRKLREMSQGVRNRDLNRVFSHVSESFQVQNTTKAELRRSADSALNSGQVTELKIWDVQLQPIAPGASRAIVEFQFKVEGSFNSNAFYRCQATFMKDPDGQWRLQTFAVFNPAVDTNQPISI